MMLFIISKPQKKIKPKVKLARLFRYILADVKTKALSNPKLMMLITALIAPIHTSI
jgi:hypothetical protein